MSYSKSSLRDLYYEAVKGKALKKSNAKPSFLPSTLGTPCLRKVFYSYKRVLPDFPFPDNVTRIMTLGNAIGEMLYSTYKKQGIVIDYKDPNPETVLPDPEFRLSSEELKINLAKIDMVCILEDKLWIAEFKSSNSKNFEALTEPKKDHAIQGSLYLYIFNKMIKEGKFAHISELDKFERAEGVKFVYYNKDNSELKEFTITQAHELFTQTVEKILQVTDYVSKNTLPPKKWDFCNSCPYRTKCKKNLIE